MQIRGRGKGRENESRGEVGAMVGRVSEMCKAALETALQAWIVGSR